MTFSPDPNLAHEHRRWLSDFNKQYLRNWENLLKADPESAMCEAAVRRLLQQNDNTVQPAEGLTGSKPSPDFRCTRSSKTFFVEVTCIPIDKATEITGLRNSPNGPGGTYKSLNGKIFNACRKKTPQCSNQKYPALVAVGTFHFKASYACLDEIWLQWLLTGDQWAGVRVGGGDTRVVTQLRSAAFLRPTDQPSGWDRARNPVSGMLLCGFGRNHPKILGALHPSPIHRFDRTCLPDVKFCRLQERYESGILSTEWI